MENSFINVDTFLYIKQFVTYEFALKLKKLGFDEECLGDYYIIPNDKTPNPNGEFLGLKYEDVSSYTKLVSAPLWQQVIDWFREKHNIHISIYPKMDVNCIDYTAKIYQYSEDSYFGEGDDEEYFPGGLKMIFEERLETYEDAREQVILKAIELCQKEK